MAKEGVNFFSVSFLRQTIFLHLLVSLSVSQNVVVFQPSFLSATGPAVTAYLLGNTSGVSLNLRTVSVSNTTGTKKIRGKNSSVPLHILYWNTSVLTQKGRRSIDPPSCVEEATRWVLTAEQIGKTALRVSLRLNQTLRLCGENDTNSDCCLQSLCVLQTLQVSACFGSTPQASLLVQASIHAQLFTATAGLDNKTVIPNQVYQPLGICPCDLTFRVCDIRCCCDQDCSSNYLKLFASHCLPGPFGGQVSPVPDYQCSVQSSENAPDWFPFLCVNSPPENNPFLGFFYQGDTIASSPGPSFQIPVLSAPVPVNLYIQGSPIVTKDGQYFTIPQMILGRCTNSSPAAFLKNFQVECVTLLHSCPTGSPLQTQPADLTTEVMDGHGGVVVVNLTDVDVSDLSLFISGSGAVNSSSEGPVCPNVTLALDYKFYWTGNSLTGVTLTRTVGSIILNGSVALTARYSAMFLNREFMPETNSGNPGYQVGKPIIAGVVGNNTELIQKTPFNIWKPVYDGLCSTAQMKPILFGENSTSGCLLAVSPQNLTQCNFLRETVTNLQEALTAATYVAKHGNPDLLNISNWVNISFVTLNSSTVVADVSSACSDVPSHQHIQVWTLTTGLIDGTPQREIRALEVSYSLSTWTLNCGGGDVYSCENLEEPQLFPITSTVTFIDILVNTGPPKTRFQINFTEYDCNRNDVCWPELAFPFTKYYTGEPYSQSLAKGMILVFMFITASILGTPWRQIRQAWQNL